MVNHRTLIKSFGYAYEGFIHTLCRQQNMRIHFLIAFLVLIFALLLHVSRIEFIVLVTAIFLVLFAEMINTVIEVTLDFVTTEHREEIKIAKDVAAGAVLLTVLFSVVVGIVIFLPYLIRLFTY